MVVGKTATLELAPRQAESLALFPAEATRRQYAHLGDPSRFVTLPIGIDLERIDAYRSRVGRADARAVIDAVIGPAAQALLQLVPAEPAAASRHVTAES